MTANDRAAAGDLGEEARRLAEAVQQWARRALPPPPGGHAGPECQWCPLCQLASVLRGEHPELIERVTEAGTALVTAVKSLVDSAAQHAPAHGATGPGEHVEPAEHTEHAQRVEPDPDDEPPRVQRIRLTDPAAAATDDADPAPEEA